MGDAACAAAADGGGVREPSGIQGTGGGDDFALMSASTLRPRAGRHRNAHPHDADGKWL